MQQTRTVLLVDDEQEVLQSGTDYLSQQGFRVVTASRWTEAIARLQESPPDLVLLDLYLPRVQGEVLLEFIREQDRDLPVLIVSSEIDAEKIEHLGRLGASGFIRKPFEMDELLLVVEQALAEREPVAQPPLAPAKPGWQPEEQGGFSATPRPEPKPSFSGPRVSPGAGAGSLQPTRRVGHVEPVHKRRIRKRRSKAFRRVRTYLMVLLLCMLIALVVWMLQKTLSSGFFGIGIQTRASNGQVK